MGDEGPQSGDVLGFKAFGEAAKIATEGVVKRAEAFLSRICDPASEELGLLFRDRISHWRALQAARFTEKAERKLQAIPNSEGWHAHPRLVGKIIENGSWVDSEMVQEMWAGLLASACTPDGRDESNLMFVEFLSQLTSSQASALAYGAENTRKEFSEAGLIVPSRGGVFVDQKQLIGITGVSDLNRLDRELDHLRALGLINGGVINIHLNVTDESVVADLNATPLGIEMYVRCQGWSGSVATYAGWPKLN